MGNEAENLDDNTPEDQENLQGNLNEDGEGTLSEEENNEEGVEIVLEGEDTQPQFTQQDLNRKIGKRVERLNKKVSQATEEKNQANAELELEKEKRKLLEVALEQARGNKTETLSAPNPDDFDGGEFDPEFLKKKQAYEDAIIDQKVGKKVAEITQQTTANQDKEVQAKALERKQVEHYERANKIGVKDYEETEDKAIEILGNEVVNQLINNFEDSEILLYYFGKNPQQAERIVGLINSNPVIGVAEIGRLRSQIKIKPKLSETPNPDEPLNGNVSGSSFQSQLDNLRASGNYSVKKALEIKKAAQEAGVTVT